jgi:hypothetical protein
MTPATPEEQLPAELAYQCEVCHNTIFSTFEECVDHEEECAKNHGEPLGEEGAIPKDMPPAVPEEQPPAECAYQCEVCHNAIFPTFEECAHHEEECAKMHGKPSGKDESNCGNTDNQKQRAISRYPHPKEVIYGDCSDSDDPDERVSDLFGSLADIQSRLVVKGKKISKERKEAKMRDAGES